MFTHEMIKSFNQLEMDVYNYIISNEEKVVYWCRKGKILEVGCR